MRLFLFIVTLILPSSSYAAGSKDDPIVTMIRVDQLEITDNNNSAWNLQGWSGKDLHKLWFKTEGERGDGNINEAEVQFLYSRAIAPYWDLQVGWRHDIKPKPARNWLAFGVQGLAPYFFETDIAAFIGERGNVGLRIKFEYEVMLTQKWVLSPEFEANVFSKNDRNVAIGSGLSDITTGLRLRYEINREFAPYIGIEWTKKFSDTASFAKLEGEKISQSYWLLGIKAWF